MITTQLTIGRMNLWNIPVIALVVLATTQSEPIDQHATTETKILYKNLKALARNSSKVMFGHHADTTLGAEGGHPPYLVQTLTHDGNVQGYIFGEKQALSGYPDELSDTKGVTGQYPAVSSFDFSQFLDDQTVTKTYLAKLAYARGQVITFSQHLNNPVTGGSPWVKKDTGDVLHTVKRILPGGDHNQKYKQNLDKIADWALNFTDSRGKLIPFIFRPLHELNGGWFWWGLSKQTQNTADDLKDLYKYIVTYLRDTRGVHNILYCISPDKFKTKDDYLKVYPGDDFVDIMGTDFYYMHPNQPPVSDLKRTLDDLVDMAEARDKIPALTETGIMQNGIDYLHNFWNDHILDILKTDSKAARIAYVLAWANHCFGNHKCQLWIPYKGHPAEADFRNNFFNDPMTLFANQISGIYN
ncbi:mannan endo-1,4-beta-mannosidase-like [Haliotis asinina]|uniref:mannan endo-1,4-beta-mannosidase-like n=1 Tax=Haliotis asinina TaxID=109174 RepID=UPI00353265D4